MRRLYDGSIIEVDGMSFKVSIENDLFCDPPWESCDGHGPVSDWEQRNKAPGEMILCTDRGHKRFYDFAAAVKQARREGWNTAPYNWKTKGEQAHMSALADFDYLRRWCNDDWQYVVLGVSLLDEDDLEMDEKEYLGGVEYDWTDTAYVQYEAENLAREIISRISGMFSVIEPHEEIGSEQEYELPATYVSI